MMFANATNFDRKPGVAEGRDLQFVLMEKRNPEGPEGRPLNFSPARKGWEKDRQDWRALEARHYQHFGVPRLWRSDHFRIDPQPLPGWAEV
jgi:hypothetical protein